MEILWLVIGVTIGVLIAWFFLDLRCRRQLAEQEERLSEASRQASRTLEQELIAHNETKQRLSEKDAKEVAVAGQLAGLNADLEASRQELESTKTDAEEKSVQLDTLRSWNDDLGVRLKAADEERARLETTLEDARKKRDAATDDSKSRITELESRLHDQAAAEARLEEERAKLEAALKEAEEERDTAADDSKSRIASLESRLRDKEEAMAPLKAELVALRAKPEEPAAALAPVTESEPASSAEEQATPAFPADNLTKIKGVGKVLKKRLNDLGITSFQQIADFTQADIDRVDKVLDFPGRIEREKWLAQARAFVDEQRGS